MGSPSVERAIQILDFLTTHPGRGFTLSELSRRLQLSKATAHGVLTTLADRGLVLRSADSNEYRLGPALVPMGTVAERGFPALTHARREAETLADEFDAECVIVMAIADEMLLVGRAGVPGPHSITSHEGQRHPLAPPLGSSLIAWAGERSVDAWLNRLGAELTDDERDRYRATIAVIRLQGYAVGVRVQRLYELSETYAEAAPHSPAGQHQITVAMAAVAHDDDYLRAVDELPADAELSSVAAPVFDADGSMVFVIALMPEDRRVRDVEALSRAVLRAAARVTAVIDGRRPALEDTPAPATRT
jgi:DNA-binding IclR family transcriptional regulator